MIPIMEEHFKVSFFIAIIFCSLSFAVISAESFKRENQKISFANFVKAASVKLNVEKLASLEIPKQECVFACLHSYECYSINFGISSSKKHDCELLATDKFRHSRNFTNDPEYDHYYIKVRNSLFQNLFGAHEFYVKSVSPTTH